LIGPETLGETVQDAEGSGTLGARAITRSSFVCPGPPAGEAPASAVPMWSFPPLRRSEPKRIDISLRPFACCNCISLNDFKIRVNAPSLNSNTTPHSALSLHSRSPSPRFPVLASVLPLVGRILSEQATPRKGGVTRGSYRASGGRYPAPRLPLPFTPSPPHVQPVPPIVQPPFRPLLPVVGNVSTLPLSVAAP
jgi:hypothetical protein